MNQFEKKNFSSRQSTNYQTAKVASIFMVVFGHFYDGLELLWVPVTVGLLVFSFSSGFFTAEKYKQGFSKKVFWIKKIQRIGITLFFADLFLLILFIVGQKPNLMTWQSLISALGLTGFLNWFHIPNTTPYGAGLWFLTLLYIFYLSYPLLLKIMDVRQRTLIFCIVYTAIMWLLNYVVPYGHMLWLTSCGFVLGVAVSKWKIRPGSVVSAVLLVGSLALMIIFNFLLNVRIFNVILILFLSLSVLFLLNEIELPNVIVRAASFFSGTIFLIYILHPYLFLNLFQSNLVNTVISILFVGAFCKMMEIIIKRSQFIWQGR